MKCMLNGLRFVVALAALALSCTVARANDIYIAQTAAGAGTGADCADAHAYTFFNTGGNWGTGGAQIGPGTIVHLCGTISSPISAQGSGISGSPITIAFDCSTSGQISMPAIPATGVLTVSGKGYIIVDGQGCGIIQSTNNGSPAGGYANRIGSQAINATNASNIEIKNLQCINLYMHIPPEQTPWASPYPVCVNFTGANTSNINIHNNVFHDCAWCAWGSGNNTSFHDNTVYNFDHGLGMGIQNDVPTVWGPVYFYNNSLSHATTWDTGSAGQYHHDGLHLWAYCSNGGSYCAGTYWNNVYVYNNHFYGDWGPINTTAFIFLQENIHDAWVFNNWGDCTYSGVQCNTGVFYLQGTNVSAYDNTMVASSATPGALLYMGGPNLIDQNNVISTSKSFVNIMATDEGGSNSTTISALRNNIYMNTLSNNTWVFEGSYISSLGTWKTDSRETNTSYSASSTVNLPAGTLQPGSPAIGAGANLYSACSGQPNPGLGALCSDANGNPRPSSGAWDAGAFSFNSAPDPPTGLKALSH